MAPVHRDAAAAPASDLVEAEALALAAELSERAQRESETARRLCSHLAAMSPQRHLTATESPRQVLTIGCRSCGVDLDVELHDPDVGAARAKQFFARHPDCLTFLDLNAFRDLTSKS